MYKLTHQHYVGTPWLGDAPPSLDRHLCLYMYCRFLAPGLGDAPPSLCRHLCLLKPRSHMYCNLSATALRLNTAATNATTVWSKLHFFGCRSIGDWLATTIPKSRRPVEDRSATGWRLIANWLEMGCDWSATGWRLVGDRLATDYRLNNLLCRCNHEYSFDELF